MKYKQPNNLLDTDRSSRFLRVNISSGTRQASSGLSQKGPEGMNGLTLQTPSTEVRPIVLLRYKNDKTMLHVRSRVIFLK